MRTNSDRTTDLLRRLLGAHHVPDVEAPANYSLVVADGERRTGVQDFNLLYRSSQLSVRTRSPRRVLEALFRFLSFHAEPPPRELLRVVALPAVIGDHAYLLPRVVMSSLKRIQPRLHRLGVRLVDGPVALVDPATSELVVPTSTLEIDQAVFDEIPEPRRMGSETATVPPGRYPLRAWALQVDEDSVGQLTRARGVAAASNLVGREEDEELAAFLDRLVSLFDGVAPVGVGWQTVDELVDSIAGVVE